MNNNFSAFKLFYDEFIYKRNSFISYLKVEDNLSNIKKILENVRKFSKIDVKAYMSNLNKAIKELKVQLDEIYKSNKPLMESYNLMYNARCEYPNEAIKDLPFIISNSFYNDYRLDDKTALELEEGNNTIPKYTSLEKKEIRKEASEKSSFEYFVGLLKDNKKYDFFLEKANIVLSLYPLYSENHFTYITRADKLVEGFEKVYKKLEDKVKLTDDYEEILLKMKIAYRKKMDNFIVEIKEMVKEHFDYLFNNKENNAAIRKHFNVANDINYNDYKEIIVDIAKEKNVLEQKFMNGEYEPVSYQCDGYLLRFREVLINTYYDQRYLLKVKSGDIDSYVNVAINLYSLAVDLENNILEYYKYLASHSKKLLRNNDVESAIIKYLYTMYNPIYCLERYDKLRKDFALALGKENSEFKKKYNNALLTKRVEYDFKGMIPNVGAIDIKLNEACKNFIIENCFDNIVNLDEDGLYDTRNYDLEVLCNKLNFAEIVDLYGKLKLVFNNIADSKEIPQKFICEVIFNRLRYDEKDKSIKMREICNKYLKEEPLFN